MNKVVVFSGNLSYSVRKGIVEMMACVENVHVLIVEQSTRKPVSRLLKNQILNLKKNGWRWIPYQTQDIVQRVLARFSKEQSAARYALGHQYDRHNLLHRPDVQHLTCTNIHDEDVLQQVADFAPDLGLSLAAPILKETLFGIPKYGTVNLHKGKVPDYRGMPPAFWELWNSETEVGCTVHRMEKGLDTGDVLAESSLPVQPYTTVQGMQLQLDELGIALVNEAVRSVLAGTATGHKQAEGGKTNRKPTLKQVAELEKKLSHANNQGVLKKMLKEALFFAYCYVYRPIPRKVLAARNNQRVVVILYHRVSDEFRDSVTVGIGQFDRQMELLSKRCELVSIEDVIDGKIPYNSTKPIVAVTFDDGYRDNYENAVPILLKHKVPTAFFVSTEIVGSSNGFAHDIEKLGRALPNMSWEHIADMHALGFTIGSHTQTHINCAKADPDKVRAELIESKATLEEKLGLEEVIFAYPFGGRDDMNSSMLESVKKAGYIACLSAYGGRNTNPVDRFNVVRTGVDANFTDLAFLARLEGLQR